MRRLLNSPVVTRFVVVSALLIAGVMAYDIVLATTGVSCVFYNNAFNTFIRSWITPALFCGEALLVVLFAVRCLLIMRYKALLIPLSVVLAIGPLVYWYVKATLLHCTSLGLYDLLHRL